MNRVALPIDAVLPEVVAALERNTAVVVRAPTGAGKTTRVPPALLDAGLAGSGQILLLEPRRLAARAAARRMAAERGGRVGDEIGYHVRFDRQASAATRLLVVTPGILLRRLLDDPFLESIGLLVFDEFHERGLDSDLALGIARLLQQTVRPDLRLVAMSATLAADRVASYLGGCPVVTSEGRLFPVEIAYRPRSLEVSWSQAAADATVSLLEQTDGDILVFLPGMQEIRRTGAAIASRVQASGVLVLPLHGDLPPEEQDRALQPQDRRRIVLATNVAETSVTVEGVSGVVDTGLARIMTYDPDLGLDRLELTPIARDSAEQRAGRAGRLRPGVCVRLWSEASHRQRALQTEPEVRRVDLAGALLHLFCMGETDWQHFPWLDPPQPAAIDRALALLRRFGAIEGPAVTALGRRLALLPVHPRLGRLLVEGQLLGHPERVAMAAALLAERDPFDRSVGLSLRERPASHKLVTDSTASDVLDRVEAMEEFERHGHIETRAGTLHPGGARSVLRVRDQLMRGLRQSADGDPKAAPSTVSADEALLRALLAAFPDRVARRRDGDRSRGVIVGGKGVRLAPSCGVKDAPLFVCIDVDSRSAEAWVRQVSAIQRDWLSPSAVTTAHVVTFDTATERVSARRVLRYEDLVLEESVAALPAQEEVARVLAEAARQRLDRVLPPPDSPGASFLLRVRFLRAWMPELDLPAFDELALGEAVMWLCSGRRSFEDLRRADWLGVLQGRLTGRQRQAVEREAPERFDAPSGSRLAIQYPSAGPPVLAVRIQELFGLPDTPRIAAGRVRLLLHLLGPNYRPQQVTDDLASFWANTYAHVRKELRTRYPRHAWPNDPTTAMPQHRPKRR
jgi:ATP-dependent helicase HrpB